MMREAAIPPPPRPPAASRVLASPPGEVIEPRSNSIVSRSRVASPYERACVDGNQPRLRVAGEVAAAPTVNTADMIRIPGGTFRMGSDKHYPEEAPAHREFWIDRTPVTNQQLREFVKATGHLRISLPIRKTIRALYRTCCSPARWCSRRPNIRSICATASFTVGDVMEKLTTAGPNKN